MIVILPAPIPYAAVHFDAQGAVLTAWDGEGLGKSLMTEFVQRMSGTLDFQNPQSIWLALNRHQAGIVIRQGRGLASVVSRDTNPHHFISALELAIHSLLAPPEPAKPAAVPEAEARETTPPIVSKAFLNELEFVLGKSIGPTNARRALLNARPDPSAPWTVLEIESLIEEMRIRIPYRGRRSVFTTEVSQLLRSHGIRKSGSPAGR